jgi:hypothetical protein
MKTLAALATAFLLMWFTASVPQLKAQEHENDRNGAKSEPNQDNRGQPETRPQEDRSRDQSAQEPRSTRPDQERSDQERSRQPQAARPQQEPRTPGQTERNENRPAQTERNQRRPVEAERGKRIPDDRFRASFGPSHKFHVRREEVVNNPQPVIVYSGYSFELLQSWPADWSYDDDCYIDYVDDQYFLFDPFHPGLRIALIVVNVD